MNSPTNERHFQSWSILINGALYLTMVSVSGLWSGHLTATRLAIICFGGVYMLASARLAQINGANILFTAWNQAWIVIAVMAFVAGCFLFTPHEIAPGACLTVIPALAELHQSLVPLYDATTLTQVR